IWEGRPCEPAPGRTVARPLEVEMSDVGSDTPDAWPKLPPVQTGIRGRCPRCGEGRLFDGFLKLRDGCDRCGLSYAFADPADGPAFFVICFGCIPAVVFALLLELW